MRVSSPLSRSMTPAFIAEKRCGVRYEASLLLNGDLALHAELLVVADRAVELVLARLREVHAEHALLSRREIRLELLFAVRPLDLEAVHGLPVVGHVERDLPALTFGSDGLSLKSVSLMSTFEPLPPAWAAVVVELAAVLLVLSLEPPQPAANAAVAAAATTAVSATESLARIGCAPSLLIA